jgi:hypothetical protein
MPKQICLSIGEISVILIIILLFVGIVAYFTGSNETLHIYPFPTNSPEPQPVQPPVIKTIHDNARYNHLEKYPERQYIGQHDYSLSSRQVGYIHNNSTRFPLFENRLGRNFYYHTLDDSRNGIRVVLSVPKNEMLYNGEVINSQELGGDYTVQMYENSGNLYNPFR